MIRSLLCLLLVRGVLLEFSSSRAGVEGRRTTLSSGSSIYGETRTRKVDVDASDSLDSEFRKFIIG